MLIHSEGDQSWVFIGRTDAKAETPVLWPPHAKCWLIGKHSDAERDWGQEKGTTEDEMAGWHHWPDGRESKWTPGVGDGQGGLACCDSWGCKELDMTERLNWIELNWTFLTTSCSCKNMHLWSPKDTIQNCNTTTYQQNDLGIICNFSEPLICKKIFKNDNTYKKEAQYSGGI